MIRSKILLAVLAALIISPTTLKAQELSDAQKAEIKKMFDEYLLNSGDKILKSVNKHQADLEEKNRLEAGKKAKAFMDELKDEKKLPMAGNAKGDITLVEFFDYNCGYCRKALEEIQTVIKKDKEVKVVFIDMPILGPPSVESAKWSLAANEQGKYFEYHKAVMNMNGGKSAENLEKIAKDLDLDVKQMKKDKDSDEIATLIDKRIAKAQEIGIRGTPGFILNGQVYPGYMPAAEILKLIKETRE